MYPPALQGTSMVIEDSHCIWEVTNYKAKLPQGDLHDGINVAETVLQYPTITIQFQGCDIPLHKVILPNGPPSPALPNEVHWAAALPIPCKVDWETDQRQSESHLQ
ncbi:hypothetical protein J1614_006504 [Plenodomus biglobosus]|nr:hypothetical protein J1614_006504 [Plenodomus biglobosus]